MYKRKKKKKKKMADNAMEFWFFNIDFPNTANHLSRFTNQSINQLHYKI